MTYFLFLLIKNEGRCPPFFIIFYYFLISLSDLLFLAFI